MFAYPFWSVFSLYGYPCPLVFRLCGYPCPFVLRLCCYPCPLSSGCAVTLAHYLQVVLLPLQIRFQVVRLPLPIRFQVVRLPLPPLVFRLCSYHCHQLPFVRLSLPPLPLLFTSTNQLVKWGKWRTMGDLILICQFL